MILARPDSTEETVDLKWIPFPGGPQNNHKAVVNNGVLFVVEDNDEDELWISRDAGMNWELFEAPEDAEDSNLNHLLSCGEAVFVTHDSISLGEEDQTPGYVTYDGGRTFQRWSAVGSETVDIDGMDCNDEYIFIASNDQNHIQWAPVSNPANMSTADAHASLYDSYLGLVAGSSELMGFADQNGDTYSNYSAGPPINMQNTGQYPVGYSFRPLGTFRPAGADFQEGSATSGDSEGQIREDRYLLGMVNTGNDLCRIYSLNSASENPSTASYAEPECDAGSDLGHLPALESIEDMVMFSYRDTNGLAGEVQISFDGGQNFRPVDLSSVWNDSGFIGDMDVSPSPTIQ